MKILPSKRKLIQLYSALLYNANLKGFITGDIFKGDSKSTCLPGLNCYSCPGAIGACPLGSIQNALAESKVKAPTYVLGIILLYCIIFGRTICGWLCPVGLLQELLYKIKTPKLKKNRITRLLSYLKYVILFVLVFALPIIYGLQSLPFPSFCKFICPAGTFEGAVFLVSNPNNNHFYSMLDVLFTWKFVLLIIFVVAAVFIYRFFCRFFCPLGALYGLFNKLSILGVKVDKSKCNHCQACITNCKMDVKEVGDHECINCGDCRNVCHCNAIEWKTIGKLIKEDEEVLEDIEVTEVENDLLIYSENEAINEQENIDSIQLNNTKTTNKKLSKSKLFKLITSIVMIVFLIFVLIYVNFFTGNDEKLNIGKVENLEITLYSNKVHNNSLSNKSTIYYFFEDVNADDIVKLDNYYNSLSNEERFSIEIIGVSDYNKKDSNKALIDQYGSSNIAFGYDNENSKALSNFTTDFDNSYFVILDSNDRFLLGQNYIFEESTFKNSMDAIRMNKLVGNKAGDICINREIGIVGSDDTFSVYENRGKITILNFWYTSCTPCLKELPYFSEIQDKYKDEVTVIAIHDGKSYSSNPSYVQRFVETRFKNYSFLVGYDDTSSSIASVYYSELGGSSTWPMTVIIDQNGIISLVKYDAATYEQLEAEVERLISLKQ